MRNLNTYAKECMRELDAIGIEYGDISRFEVNTRAKKRWGQCRAEGNGKYTISINKVLLDERNDVEGLKSTIMHELLHSCEGCMNHGPRWKSLAKEVNRVYNYKITRCSTSQEKGVTEQMKIIPNYVLKCENCGCIIERERMSKAIKHPEMFCCAKCKGKLVRIK